VQCCFYHTNTSSSIRSSVGHWAPNTQYPIPKYPRPTTQSPIPNTQCSGMLNDRESARERESERELGRAYLCYQLIVSHSGPAYTKNGCFFQWDYSPKSCKNMEGSVSERLFQTMTMQVQPIQVLLANGILLCDRIWPIYDFVAS